MKIRDRYNICDRIAHSLSREQEVIVTKRLGIIARYIVNCSGKTVLIRTSKESYRAAIF